MICRKLEKIFLL